MKLFVFILALSIGLVTRVRAEDLTTDQAAKKIADNLDFIENCKKTIAALEANRNPNVSNQIQESLKFKKEELASLQENGKELDKTKGLTEKHVDWYTAKRIVWTRDQLQVSMDQIKKQGQQEVYKDFLKEAQQIIAEKNQRLIALKLKHSFTDEDISADTYPGLKK